MIPISLAVSAYLVFTLFLPLRCTASPLTIDDEQTNLNSSSLLNSSVDEASRWKQNAGTDDDPVDETEQGKNVTESIEETGTAANDTSSENPQSNTGDGENGKENTDKLVMKYYCDPEFEPCPPLKHYYMYPEEPEHEFYPSWTFHGFTRPADWHNVPIKYFEAPPLKIIDSAENYDIRKHGSSMHLCSEEVTEDIESCKKKMKNECASSMPSPIDIVSKEVVEDPNLKDMGFINYNEYFGFEMYFETDGSQLLFIRFLPHGKDRKVPGIRKGPLESDNKLFLDRIIVRVGFDYDEGSEHSLDGEYFGMEFQFYFTADDLPYWQTLSQYKTLPENDGSIGQRMHVVSIFAQVTAPGKKPANGSSYAGEYMETLSLAAEMFWEGVNNQQSSTVRVEKKVLSLEDFFGEPSLGAYYTYQGSLSHPPCLTHVGWTVFEKPIWIKYHQWKRFAYVHAEYSDYTYLAGNIRPQSEILVKADMDMYLEMKRVEGYGELRQSELDEAAENTRQPILFTGNERSPSPPKLFLIRNYVDYKKYFARRVRKSINVHDVNSRVLNEYDYYDGEKGGKKSGAVDLHSNRHASILRTIATLLLMLYG